MAESKKISIPTGNTLRIPTGNTLHGKYLSRLPGGNTLLPKNAGLEVLSGLPTGMRYYNTTCLCSYLTLLLFCKLIPGAFPGVFNPSQSKAKKREKKNCLHFWSTPPR